MTPLTKEDLIQELARGCKPPEDFRIGTEHECFVLLPTHQRASYEGHRQSIRGIFESLKSFGWQPQQEKGYVIGMYHPQTQAAISLEPGGQFELAGAPLKTLHDSYRELIVYQQQLASVSRELGLHFKAVGFDPYNRRSEVPWMPKDRYQIMRAYMPTRGNLGVDMMTRTCTVQVNLDYSSEADMVRKMRVSMALQPMVTALFANSSWIEGKKSPFACYRCFIWQDTDSDRCGILPFVFQDGMGFERYVEYMLDVPMYFIRREGVYRQAAGQSFRDFMQGTLPAWPGMVATLSDWQDHLTTAFPEVRLKRYLEMRGADSGPLEHLIGLPAFWVGLLYDPCSLQAVVDLTSDWTYTEVQDLYQQVPRQGRKAFFREIPLQDWLCQLLHLSHQGLERRGILNDQGSSEALYLRPLQALCQS